jgi:gliding motility-associated-like protein
MIKQTKNFVYGLVLTPVTVAIYSITVAQNLVPNPSFEEVKQLPCDLPHYSVPYGETKEWFSSILNNWTLPTFFPSSVLSIQLDVTCTANPIRYNNGYPKDGKNMVAITLFQDITIFQETNGRSYIQVKLNDKLTEGKTYRAGGFHALANNFSTHAANNLGMLFTQEMVQSDTNLILSQYKPQLVEKKLNKELNVWKKFGGCFSASGGEHYLTIGGFLEDKYTEIVQVIGGDNQGSELSAYLIDSVFVEQVKEPFIPNVITPNGDCCNEKFVLKDAISSEWSVTILNRWGNRVYHSSSYKNDWDGSDVNGGVYFYYVQHRECKNLAYKGSLTIIH